MVIENRKRSEMKKEKEIMTVTNRKKTNNKREKSRDREDEIIIEKKNCR
jgi:hypothetical protein